MLKFLTSLSMAGTSLKESAARLLAGERRRANDFGQGDNVNCQQLDYSWAQDWIHYAGMLSFTAPVAKGFTYVIKTSDAAYDRGARIPGIWWGSFSGSLDDIKALNIDGMDAWELNPLDANYDNLEEQQHYLNIGYNWGPDVPDPGQKEIDFYFCSEAPKIDIKSGELLLDSTTNQHLAETMANIAGFLAQTSWESAAYTACDENNHLGRVNASCTQRGDNALYQNVNDGPYACPLDPTMNITANTSASWAIGPLECTQHTETENCCWWGRGAIQTTGPTNYGALQAEVINKRENSDIDLCKDPGLLCTEDDLKWTAGVFFWVTQVQVASCYVDSLIKYTENWDILAEVDGCDPFALGVGGVVNNGAWNDDAHGNFVDAANHDIHDEAHWGDAVDGRISRFAAFMSPIKAQLLQYDTSDPPSLQDVSHCTGNDEIDYILEKANIAEVAGISDSKVYSWSGFCTALREFKA